ncbi:MAG TPA: hypothetical protein DDX98_04850 [Bacteroidales bacterium]|nr:hypothetical protein [Bacteroidales bacterium]
MKRITSLLVCFAMFGLSVLAQDIQITGKVTSADDGSILPGVSVVVKGTTIGTTTNVDGEYSISAPSDATLVFSFVGMKVKEVAVGGQTTIDMAMEMDVTGLEEVVVTAFGISREKKAVAYVTEEVDSDKLLAGQATRAASALAGKVAGLQINVQDNGVNPSSQILLRGLRSPTANNEALIGIDGAIASSGAFDDLNANDIESINVLKGATAAALYGADASNGALIVTTKKGAKDERFKLGFSNATTLEVVNFMPDFQSEYGTGWDGEYNNIENTNWGPRFDGQLRQIGPTFADGSYQAVPYAPVKDNLKEFYNTGTTVQNTLYMTGGNATGNFYMSLGNQHSKGIIPGDLYDRYTFRVNASKKLGKVELGISTSYMSDETSVVGDQIGDQDRTFYWFVLNTPANIPLTSYKDWENPESFGYADNYFNAFYQNPYWAIGTNRNKDRSNRIIGNANLKWDIVDNISFSTRFGVNRVAGFGKNWRARQEYDPVLQPYHSTVSSFVEDTEYQDARYTADFLLQGDFNITEDISLKAILGSAIQSRKYRDSYIRANNLSIPDFYDISNGTGEKIAVADAVEKRTAGVFADLTLGYQNWVYLNLTGRQDWTSTLPKEERSYFYPGGGVSVILSEAIPALQGNPVLSFLKVTANNSTVYRDPNPYAINERYFQAGPPVDFFRDLGFPYGSINGFRLSAQAVDPSLKKERVNSTEFGLNTAFLQGRFTLDAAVFFTKTTDLIVPTTSADASGARSFLTNIGELEGEGYEITLGGKVVQVGDFVWDLSVNVTHYDQKVVKVKDNITEIALDVYTAGYGTYAIEGKSYPQIKTISYVRNPDGKIVIDPATGNPVIGELEAKGKTTPEVIFGFNTEFRWQGLSLSATMDWRKGYIYYAQGMDLMEFTGRSMESVSAGRKDFVWPNSVYLEDGAWVNNTNIPISNGVMTFWQDHYNLIKENYIRVADAFKVREIALNYELPSKMLEGTKYISKVRVGLVGRNLFTILPSGQTKFSDPEFRNTRSTDDPNGIGIGGYLSGPPTRSYGFSVNIEF